MARHGGTLSHLGEKLQGRRVGAGGFGERGKDVMMRRVARPGFEVSYPPGQGTRVYPVGGGKQQKSCIQMKNRIGLRACSSNVGGRSRRGGGGQGRREEQSF